MKVSAHVLFWLVVIVLLTAVFTPSHDSFQQSFYFVTMLLPVVVGTCYFFNLYLVPKYLLTRRYGWFALYFVYLVIVSIYLEMIVITFSFVLLAEYSLQNMPPVTRNVFVLAVALYFIVFLFSFILLIRQTFSKQKELDQLTSEKERDEIETFTVKANRKTRRIDCKQVLYIESLSDHVQIHLLGGENVVTREKISELTQKLPTQFLRIHRSFIVNTKAITSYTREVVSMGEIELPISRSFKKEVMGVLGG